MFATAGKLRQFLFQSLKDIAPIILVVFYFQSMVLQRPLENVQDMLLGLTFVILGLTFFIHGLEQALFPMGESLAHAFAKKGSLFWLLLFSFSLGFGTTVAEPALISICNEAAKIAGEGKVIGNSSEEIQHFSNSLKYTVALSVGISLVLGVIRILKGWPIRHFILWGYVSVMVFTFFAPKEIIGIAYDSGGVTTSTITVPLVTALGVGLASSIQGRNPMTDGFGLIAFASLMPIIFVLVFGIIML
ncbi:MAG: hypothetical protein COW84_10675 [Gammaproteobacteria bacterium CG22_combo_CG10-13_8_21_14_all_40_8]|nr:MAG: hypothetical protein COW84_10675 [Gammaproteobacteria bacterium CG22_combo_CG10-13_8_21_14_all_40_8]